MTEPDVTMSEDEVEAPDECQPVNPYTSLSVLEGHTDIVRILLCIKECRFASAGDDCKVIIWDIETGEQLFLLEKHTRPVTTMVLLEDSWSSTTADAPLLLTASSDRRIIMWSPWTGDCLHVEGDICGSVKCLSVFPCLPLVASGGNKLVIWNNSWQNTDINISPQHEDTQLIHALKKGKLITAAEKQLTAYTLQLGSEGRPQVKHSRKLQPPHRDTVRVIVTINDDLFASASLDGSTILWTTESLVPSRCFNHNVADFAGNEHVYPYSVQSLRVYQQRYLLAAVGCGFCLYDSSTGKMLLQKRAAHHAKVLLVSWQHSWSCLVSSSEDGSVRMWALVVKQTADNQDIKSTMKRNESLNMGDLYEAKLVGEMLGHSGAVQSFITCGPEVLVTCGADGQVLLWKSYIERLWKRYQAIRNVLQRYR